MNYSLFDPYEIKTSFLPAMIILLPILLAVLSVFQVEDFPLKDTIVWNLTIFITLLFAISMCVRYLGQKKGMKRKETKEEVNKRVEKIIETKKEEKTPGPLERKDRKRQYVDISRPSTEYLRRYDEKFNKDTKEEISNKCKKMFDRELKSDGEVDKQDTQNAKVFGRILDYLYKENPDGLWHKQQTLFHHARNLNGSRRFFALIGLASIFSSGLVIGISQKAWPGIIFVINCVYVLAVFLYIWRVVPYSMRRYAEYYAEEAITTFLVIAPPLDTKPEMPKQIIYIGRAANIPTNIKE